jgi:hypothetical protein
MVGWEYPTNPREASGLDPEAVHYETYDREEMTGQRDEDYLTIHPMAER